MAKIQIRRGTKAQLDSLVSPDFLDNGELGFTTDTGEVYIGTGNTNSVKHLVGKVMVGTTAGRPTAGISGRMYLDTDMSATYVDDGTNWVDVSSGIGSIDDIADGTTYVRTKAGAVSNGFITKLTDNAGANPLTKIDIDNHITDDAKHRVINDIGVGTNELWSSSKIQDEIAIVVSGIDPQESVKDITDVSVVTGQVSGDRYINNVSNTLTLNSIYQWDGTSWEETVVDEGMYTWVEDEDTAYVFNGTSWVKFGSTVTHNNLNGLNDGDFKHLTNTQLGELHAELHTVASHSDTTATGPELDELTDGSTTTLHNHAVSSHTIASHSDTTATGAELNTLTDGSNADTLHVHTASAITNFNAGVIGVLSATDTSSIDMSHSNGAFSADLLAADGGSFV